MEESIYTYVNKFPKFETIISSDEINTGDPDKTNCKSFREVELKEYTDIKTSFVDTCSKIAEHHQQIIKKANTPQIALCKYINYWIYDTLMSKQKFPHNVLLDKFYGKVKNLEFCGNYKKKINKNTYEELKELYNIYEPFFNLKKALEQDSSVSCEVAENFFKLYEKSAGKCKSNYKHYICWELIKIRAEYEQNRAFAKRCKDQMKYLTPIENDILPTILFPFVVMSLISFVFIYLYNFTSFDSWLLSKLPGAKKKTKKKVHRIHELHRTSEMEGRRYKLPYHS